MSIAPNNLQSALATTAVSASVATIAERPNQSTAKPTQKLPAGRLVFIDGLRGVAAMFVMLFHFYTPVASKLYFILNPVLPAWLSWPLLQGYVGVEIFYVVSGFVIAYTLRNEICTPKYAANFMIRRSIRLDPPYWTVIALVLGYRCVLWHNYTSSILHYWGTITILSNMFYVADLMDRTLILGVAWTLCQELQFYLTIITMLMIAHQVRNRFGARAGAGALVSIFVALTASSIAYRYGADRMNYLGMWFNFAIGALLAWMLTGKLHERWLWVSLAAVFAGQLWRVDYRIDVALVTVMLIYLSARLGKMTSWLSWGWIQYLGKISYSLYLIHLVVGAAVIYIFIAFGDNSPTMGIFAFISAVATSLIGANVLHQCVEAPCIRLAKRLKTRPSIPAAQPASLPPATPRVEPAHCVSASIPA